ncbi:MAG: hypothetical protein ACM3VT_19020 [Solirubrobacterales bacterium]
MGLSLRKFAVGLVALSVLAGVFFLYLRLDRTPPIVVDATKPMAPLTAEVNDSNSQESSGEIQGVRIGPIEQLQLVHRDASNRIDRMFGFDQVVHKQGNQWQIAKPYMWIYLERFVCRVTADSGRAQLVEGIQGVMPSDVQFTGNVVIHVTPTHPGDSWEFFIHLDDVGFLAEKSLFSSTGAVRFLSRAMRLTGTGMELIYDGPRSRLELFRVFDLDSLRFRSSEIKKLAKKNKSEDSAPQDVSAKAQESHVTSADSNTPADVYQCIFRRNVRLDDPNMVAIARDVLSINNIQWNREEGSGSKDKQTVDPNETKDAPSTVHAALDTTASSYPVMSSIPDELYDIVVTCDGGADITLLGAPGLVNASKIQTPENSPAPAAPDPNEIVPSDRQQIVAQRVDFDFLSNDTAMSGPVAMRLLVDANSLGGTSAEKPVPVDVTALGAVRYLAMLKQIVLEGGTTATLHRVEPNSTSRYYLAAPRLTLDLAVGSKAADEMKVDLRRFVADGGVGGPAAIDPASPKPVTVRMRRWTAGKLAAWGALDAHELRYDKELGLSSVVGPGFVWLHNTETIRSKDDPNAVLEPCYVRLSNFDGLKYWDQSKRIVAEDDSQQLLLDYFPLIDGNNYGPLTQVVAGHVEATLQEIDKSKLDLLTFVASQGIEYDSEIDNLHFIGSQMAYDQIKSLIAIQGDDQRPCYLNGTLVDGIVMDPKTRKVETQITSPSIFQIRR